MPAARPPRPRPGADPDRRRLLGALLAVPALATGGLAGCSDGPAAPVDENGPIELSVFWWGNTRRAEATERALRLYSSRNPRVTFRVTWQAASGYYDRLATQAGGGNVPDLFQVDDTVLTEYAQRGIALDLSPYAADGRLDLGGLPPGLADYGRVDGRLYGVPAAQTHAAVVYNKDLLRRLGVPAPTIMPWADYLAWAARVTQASGGRVAGTMDPSGDHRALWLWLRGQGGKFYQGRQLGFSSAALVDWFELWQRARNDRATPAAALVDRADGGEPARQLVVTGHTAASFAWSHQLPELQRNTDDELGLAAFPGPPAAQWDWASMYWAGFHGTRHPGVVADVVNFLTTNVEVGRILGTDRGLPADLAVRQTVTQASDDPVVKRVATLGTSLNDLVGPAPAPPPRGHARVRALLTAAAQDVRSGRVGARATTSKFMARAQGALAE
ncbi:multiple sugar transport system substrate-binding protein [Micromonospora sp. A200]|uniref:ABC transporter substrate-binding protein n=1 Tax=Micromonospora sp. A200 TaxID=2940568 RepID=UPI002474F802|nr:extracellular solute-binding protein [Micromonospora sp. A200]MDH6465894.1 multiple sugar transport system substrate-binding protein [Micromonospora sp. A200]